VRAAHGGQPALALTSTFAGGRTYGTCSDQLPKLSAAFPTFIPTTERTNVDAPGRRRNVCPAQRTFPDVGERQFGIYDLFEGTEQIQQLVISRAISGVHIR
jgi:hypothetical protein